LGGRLAIIDQEQGDNDEPVRFVHGTTIYLWSGDTVLGIGRGDFGAGFYTFEDNRWGQSAAEKWAHRKAAGSNIGGLVRLMPSGIPIQVKPILVHVELSTAIYRNLRREDITDGYLNTAYRQYYPDELTGRDLVPFA